MFGAEKGRANLRQEEQPIDRTRHVTRLVRAEGAVTASGGSGCVFRPFSFLYLLLLTGFLTRRP
jgi:hypothetical protein